VVLVADELGPLPETSRSRCQLVPFRRLSEKAIRAEIDARAPDLLPAEAIALARVAGGRLDRVGRLLDSGGARRRTAVLEVARAVYADPAFDPAEAARIVLELASERGAEARAAAEAELEGLDYTAREAEQRARRAQRGAEREETLLALDELAAWYRDLVVLCAGAERAVVHVDHHETLRCDATIGRMLGAEQAAETVRETWRAFEEFNVAPSLALESLFVRLSGALGHAPAS
jgi:hypothetical protein